MNKRLSFWRKLTLASYFLLLLHIAFWFFIADSPANSTFAVLSVIYLLILFLPMKQLLAKNPRVYLWSGYLVLLYFTHAVVEAYANPAVRGYALLELMLSISYFVGSTFCYRYSRQAGKVNQKDIA